MKRREFVKLCGATASAGIIPLVSAAQPNLVFPTSPRERLAVSSWPFRKQFSPRGGAERLENFPAMVVSRFHVKGIEPLNDHFPSTDPGYLDIFKNALAKAGAHVVNIPTDPHGSLYDPDRKKRLAAIATANHWVDVAAAIGSPSIRVSVTGSHAAKPDSSVALESLKAIAAYGTRKNIIINLENDDPHSEDAFFLTSIIDKANTPYLRALPDFCNSMIEKNGDEAFNDAALKAMFQRAYNISHVKDSEMDGDTLYRVNIDKCFAIAKAAGYKGYYSMEWEGKGEPYAGTEKLIEMSVKNLTT
ncbi:MAG TPA: sugar phosphate isomerase/epimerase family protein [Bryobacteraceae bacterium]|jgi:sugar phosphate isomerase/epimerase